MEITLVIMVLYGKKLVIFINVLACLWRFVKVSQALVTFTNSCGLEIPRSLIPRHIVVLIINISKKCDVYRTEQTLFVLSMVYAFNN